MTKAYPTPRKEPKGKAPQKSPSLGNAPTIKKGRVTKVSIERFTKILRQIRSRNGTTMQQLRDVLGVSKESVKRDLDFLRDRLNCPLDYDRKSHKWV